MLFLHKNVGEQTIPSPSAFTEGLFTFINYFSEKEGFKNRFTVK